MIWFLCGRNSVRLVSVKGDVWRRGKSSIVFVDKKNRVGFSYYCLVLVNIE